jgi:pimeloyl-ACP methyl ester carboxylesterase
MVPILQQLLQKYKDCILERYETKQDMINRGLDGNLSGLFTTNGLQVRDNIKCVAGNNCSLAFRTSQYSLMQAQANRGEATNFQSNLENIIPADCFECQKHKEFHTKHVHCTMDAGGNSGIPQGPTFLTCKAGVDIDALAKSVINDLAGTLHDLTNVRTTPPDKTGGPSIATNYSTVRFDSCPNPAKGCPEQCDYPDNFSGVQRSAVVPAESGGQRLYFEPSIPVRMLDTPPPAGSQLNIPAAHNIGRNEGRLRPELRSAAAAAKPRESLRLAAYQFAGGDTEMGNAFADLSVTGSRSFAAFLQDPPQESFCQSVAAQHPSQLTEANVLAGCRTALDRAYRVANFLRTGQRGDTPEAKTAKMNERNALDWIAVSGEDDSPHRPVNVPSSDYPQYDMDVVVEAPMAAGSNKSVTVHARYVVAQSQPEGGTGRNLVVISFDLPTSGYSTNLDYESISPLAAIGNPKWTVLPVPLVIPGKLPYQYPVATITGPGSTILLGTPIPDFQATGKTPLLDFIETFIVRFAETLDQKVAIKNNIKAVMGGSLGGNMTFRLGRRPNVPWLRKFIVWSPASIWSSLGEGGDVFKHYPVRVGWEGADQARKNPSDGDRAAFFASWDKMILPLVIPMAQSDTWTSDFYLCKKSAVAAARLERHETYDARFYAWHWRLGAEQLLYSHLNKDPATNKPLYLSNQKPMLLACGVEDHVAWNDICPATQTTAQLMTFTPGKALFLDKTGHSLDNERRSFWAQQILDFIK